MSQHKFDAQATYTSLRYHGAQYAYVNHLKSEIQRNNMKYYFYETQTHYSSHNDREAQTIYTNWLIFGKEHIWHTNTRRTIALMKPKWKLWIVASLESKNMIWTINTLYPRRKCETMNLRNPYIMLWIVQWLTPKEKMWSNEPMKPILHILRANNFMKSKYVMRDMSSLKSKGKIASRN